MIMRKADCSISTESKLPDAEAHAEQVVKGASFTMRMSRYFTHHPVWTSLLLGIVVFICLGLIFWFTIFSGLGTTADFVYSRF